MVSQQERENLHDPMTYMQFTCVQLKAKLRERGLHVSGLKKDLCNRLAEYEERLSSRETSAQDIKLLRDIVYRGDHVPGEAFVFARVAREFLMNG